ncbi:MAG: FadR/GntR family transcriptional regulator [Kineosporiaceae bacterium]
MTGSPYTPLTPRPLWSAVADQLRELIVAGAIPVGSRLPPERTLCAQLAVSRLPLREALRVLQASGYVETRPGSGTYARLPDPTPATWIDEDIHVVELFELRLVVEPNVAGLAARRRSGEDLTRLAETVAVLREAGTAGDREAAVAADAAFHTVLAASAANTALTRLMDRMQELTGTERRVSLDVPGQIARAVADHERILDAVAGGDAEAATAAMAAHLRAAADLVGEHRHPRPSVPRPLPREVMPT